MRKIKEVLRLRFESKLSIEKIGRACRMSTSTVHDTLVRFRVEGLVWPLPEDMDEFKLGERLYRDKGVTPVDDNQPDWKAVYLELRKNKSVTLALLWEEYRKDHPAGYNYSWFCETYAKYRDRLEPVMRQVHKMGEKCFVDYAGQKFSVVDPTTGEVREAELFVGVLGGSNYTYAEATWSQESHNWLSSHVRMFEYFQGSSEILVPDNLKPGVKDADFYEPNINPSYQDLAEHYHVAVIPARSRRPKDKAKVENGVLIAERWIMAALRKRIFYSLGDLNEAIGELLKKLNDRPFQKLDGSRQSIFVALEKPALRPLPEERYCYSQWKKAKVNIDYHIELDHHYYSVPYELIHEQVEARLTASTVEVFREGKRIVSHRRSFTRGGRTTLKEHMPAQHAKMLEWTPERIEKWAEKVGPFTRTLVSEILSKWPHPQQGFRSALGVLKLAKKVGEARMEAASQHALANHAFSYRSVKSILETGLDRLPQTAAAPERPNGTHKNVRGQQYYRREEQI